MALILNLKKKLYISVIKKTDKKEILFQYVIILVY